MPRTVLPSMKVTIPVGIRPVGMRVDGVTVTTLAVRVRVCPAGAGLALEAIMMAVAAAVAAGVMTWLMVELVAAWKFWVAA